jgi:exonuclease III
MRALFWNIRGFGRRGRRTLLKEYLRLHRIDLVFLQETIKQDFMDTELRSLEVGDKFFWLWLPANGHSGGMLVGARDSIFEVGAFDRGQFFLSLSILHRASNRILEVIGIYGPADHGRSRAFLDEISTKLEACNRPVLMGGDFNLIRAATDKNNDNLNWPLIDLFNEHIANWALRELPRTGRGILGRTNRSTLSARCLTGSSCPRSSKPFFRCALSLLKPA